jgi:outer membrane lipoprotein-sorting protein
MITNLMTELVTILRKLSIIIIISISVNSEAISFDKKFMLENKIERFFEDLNTMEGEFIQVSPSGIISNGKIFIDLPGKIRLDYINPDNLLITCKGFWLVIQDRNL